MLGGESKVQSSKFNCSNYMRYSHSWEAVDVSLEEVRWSESTSDHSCGGRVPEGKQPSIHVLREGTQTLCNVSACVGVSPSSDVLISRWQATSASSREAACGDDPEARSRDCITAVWKPGSSWILSPGRREREGGKGGGEGRWGRAVRNEIFSGQILICSTCAQFHHTVEVGHSEHWRSVLRS